MKPIRKFHTVGAWVAASISCFVVALAVAQTTLPAGEGKDLVEQVCAASCHGAESWSGMRMDKESWAPLVRDMAERAEPRTDKELETMVNYLAKHFGPETAAADKVNINKATAQELEQSLALSSKDATDIVQYREKNGSFKSFDDVKKVPDLDVAKLEQNKDRLEY
jgi:competence protein ComEA